MTYYQKNRDVIHRAKAYYENDKERLREEARDKYRNLSEEEKNKKREYRKNRYAWRKKIKTKGISNNIIARLESLNIKMNKNSFLILIK